MKFRWRSALFVIWMFMFVAQTSNATVNITTSRIQYSCNGSTTVFAYPFKVYEDDDLEVIITDSADAETTLILNTDYTVSGAGDTAGGNITITLGSVCPNNYTLTALRNIDITQDTDYSDGQTLTADGLEAPPDKSRIIDQQILEDSARSIKIIKSSTLTDLTVIPAADQAIFFNGAGTGLETRSLGSTTLAVPADDSITGDMIKDSEVFVFPTMLNLKKGADVASASALPLGIDGNSFDVTGTTTVTSIVTKGIGTVVYLHFDASLTLTHHATDLILPNDNDIVTQAGDVAIFKEYTVGNWELVSYQSNKNTSLGMMRWLKGADVASAGALTLGDDGNYFDVTGTTTVTSIATKGIGTIVKLHFDGALTLTHSADLFLPTAANITTVAGDEAEFVEYASGDWRCTNYQRADGTLLINTNKVIQSIYKEDATKSTGSTPIVLDDSIPQQSSDGFLVISESITPTDASNKIRIEATIYLSSSAGGSYLAAPIYQDSTEDALAIGIAPFVAADIVHRVSVVVEITAGSTSPTTFKIFGGFNNAATVTVNGVNNARIWGGALLSTIRLTEISP